MRYFWFLSGFAMGLVGLSLAKASVPKNSEITDDSAIYQSLSEINLPKEKPLNFDADLKQLGAMESRYHEKVQPLSVEARRKAAVKRVSMRKYEAKAKRHAVHSVHRAKKKPTMVEEHAPSMGVPDDIESQVEPVNSGSGDHPSFKMR